MLKHAKKPNRVTIDIDFGSGFSDWPVPQKTTKKKVGHNPSSSTGQNYKLQLWMIITTQNLQ
jgi:hypothetical protein